MTFADIDHLFNDVPYNKTIYQCRLLNGNLCFATNADDIFDLTDRDKTFPITARPFGEVRQTLLAGKVGENQTPDVPASSTEDKPTDGEPLPGS